MTLRSMHSSFWRTKKKDGDSPVNGRSGERNEVKEGGQAKNFTTDYPGVVSRKGPDELTLRAHEEGVSV